MLSTLEGQQPVPHRLGTIILRDHQQQAVRLLHQMIARYGGALLADDVGTGKTFCALGVAAQYKCVLVVAPAALRDRWHDAAAQTDQPITFISFQALSRNPLAAGEHRRDLIIVDEAHHVRTRTTRRYAAVAALTMRTPVLLMSATPLHNHVEDLHALCALFLGSGVRSLAAADLAPIILRRRDLSDHNLPAVSPLRWHPVAADTEILESIVGIPSPLPAADEGQAAALSRFVLLRQWCSSDEALAASLDRLRRRAIVLDAELARGRLVTRHDLMQGLAAGDADQLTLSLSAPDEDIDAHSLRRSLHQHHRAVAAALQLMRRRTGPAVARWSTVSAILRTHRAQRAVLFTHSTDTARSCFAALMNTHRLACLDGDRARVASGRVRRADVVASFRPGARPACAMRIDALITTDVLSEGIDLHDASVLVHLDLPWTMARVEQRLGRLRRLGSPHQIIEQHALAPPAAANGIVRILERLAKKAGLAAEHIRDDPVFQSHTGGTPALMRTSDVISQIRTRLATLEADAGPIASPSLEPVAPERITAEQDRRPAVISDAIVTCAYARSSESGAFLAALSDGRLISGARSSVTPSLQNFALACEEASAAECYPSPARVRSTLATIDRWLQVNDILPGADTLSVPPSDAHVRIAQVIDSALNTGRRSQRALMAEWAARARACLAQIRGAGAERELDLLVGEYTQNSMTSSDSACREHLTDQLARYSRPLPRAIAVNVDVLVLLGDQQQPRMATHERGGESLACSSGSCP